MLSMLRETSSRRHRRSETVSFLTDRGCQPWVNSNMWCGGLRGGRLHVVGSPSPQHAGSPALSRLQHRNTRKHFQPRYLTQACLPSGFATFFGSEKCFCSKQKTSGGVSPPLTLPVCRSRQLWSVVPYKQKKELLWSLLIRETPHHHTSHRFLLLFLCLQ